MNSLLEDHVAGRRCIFPATAGNNATPSDIAKNAIVSTASAATSRSPCYRSCIGRTVWLVLLEGYDLRRHNLDVVQYALAVTPSRDPSWSQRPKEPIVLDFVTPAEEERILLCIGQAP